MKYTYIGLNIKGFYITLENPLSETLYKLGSTYLDFLDNKWILLSDEQVKFKEDNPNATVKEVFDMELTPVPERTLEDAIREKIYEIDNYDNSSAVNEFIVNDVISAWFTPAERSNYKNSIDSAKIVGVNTLNLYIGGELIQLNTFKAEQLLAAILLYADLCYIVTSEHKKRVAEASTIEEVDNYDYTLGYPNKLNFNLVTNEDNQEPTGEEKDI